MNANTRISDPLDIRIAKLLARNGRASNRDIARRLGVSEGNVCAA